MMHQYRAQFELEKSQGRFLTTRQRMAYQKKLAALPQTPKPAPLTSPAFVARLADVSADNPKIGTATATLDGLPINLRQRIFYFAEQDIKNSNSDWKCKQITEYDSLKLVSKQFYHDLQDMRWQHWLVRKHQTAHLLELPFFNKPFSLTTPDRASPLYERFKSLSLEVSFGTSDVTLKDMTLALLALPLTELKLFFTGCDGHGTRTQLGFCGLKAGQTAGKLPVDGQDFRRRAILINTLSRLGSLETLVISNANMPVTPSQVINNKPRLKRLAITCDPRTTVTDDWTAALNDESDEIMQYAAAGSTVPLDTENLPDVQELEITANSMLLPTRMVREALHTLKKLTWTVPNIENQSDGLPDWQLDWLSQTSEILLVSAMNGIFHKLETLRICIEQPILETNPNRKDRNPAGDLLYGLKDHLPRMVTVKNLELHINMPDGWCNEGMKVVGGMSRCLERFYISEQMVQRQHARLISRVFSINFGSEIYSLPKVSSPREGKEAKRKDRILANNELAFFGYEFTSDRTLYRVIETSEDQPITHEGVRDAAVADEDMEEGSAASEGDSMIIDMEGLGRVEETMESEQAREARREALRSKYCDTADVGIELLRLNGRLLDRERNKHLFLPNYTPGDHAEDKEEPVAPGTRPARRFPVIIPAAGMDHWMCE